jgi:hypothetical protein
MSTIATAEAELKKIKYRYSIDIQSSEKLVPPFGRN